MNTTQILKNGTPDRSMQFRGAFNPVKRLFGGTVVALLAVFATLSAHALPIKNGGFETGDLGAWLLEDVLFDGGVTSAESYSGSYCLKMGAMDGVYQELTTLKRFGTLRFKAMADSYAGPAYATVEYYGDDGSYSEIMFGGGYLSSDGWTTFELDLDSTKRVARVSFWVGESYPIYIDNVALLDP